jgi:hypothetical protein
VSPLGWASVVLFGLSLLLRGTPAAVQGAVLLAQLVVLGLWVRQVYARRTS